MKHGMHGMKSEKKMAGKKMKAAKKMGGKKMKSSSKKKMGY